MFKQVKHVHCGCHFLVHCGCVIMQTRYCPGTLLCAYGVGWGVGGGGGGAYTKGVEGGGSMPIVSIHILWMTPYGVGWLWCEYIVVVGFYYGCIFQDVFATSLSEPMEHYISLYKSYVLEIQEDCNKRKREDEEYEKEKQKLVCACVFVCVLIVCMCINCV